MTEPASASPPDPRSEHTRWILAAILLVALAARLYLLFTTHRTAEDFYITLRYAENIANGRGFVSLPMASRNE